MKKSFGIIALLLLAALAIGWWFNHAPEQALLAFGPIGIALDVGARTSEYSYTTSTVQGIGTVVFVRSPKLTPTGATCELGALYRIKKANFSQYRTRWATEAELKQAAKPGDIPPSVREFADSYLVYEPSQSVCSTNQSLEIELRSVLLAAISRAEAIAPAQ